jgi:hypothetical protein
LRNCHAGSSGMQPSGLVSLLCAMLR